MRDRQISQIQDARVRRIVEQLELNGFAIVPRTGDREFGAGAPTLITLERVMQQLIDEVAPLEVLLHDMLIADIERPSILDLFVGPDNFIQTKE